MATMQRSLRRLIGRNSLKIGVVTLYALLGFLTLAVLAGLLATPRRTAFADSTVKSNEPWLEINCLETVVEEGDDFRLLVNKKFDSDWPHPAMRVFWYTFAITADESDYEHLYAERQSSNGYQSKHGRMGRDFHTLEDSYPEVDETFRVWFNNSVGYGHDGECIITITDDDGVGIYSLEITSVPGELPSGSNDGETLVAYTTGDVIEITAHFTGPATNGAPSTGEQADYAALYIQVGENRRLAEMLRGDGTDTVVFGYQVQADDVDADGISVEGGGPGTGLYYSETNRDGGIWAVDHPDDYGANPGGVIRPGEPLTAVINSDVAPDHPGLNQWDWAVSSGGETVPVFGVESLDDRDVLNFEISEEGSYQLSVADAPTGVGIWRVWGGDKNPHSYYESGPMESVVCDFEPGTYQVEVGTPYQSVGNTGSFTVSLEEVADDAEVTTAA